MDQIIFLQGCLPQNLCGPFLNKSMSLVLDGAQNTSLKYIYQQGSWFPRNLWGSIEKPEIEFLGDIVGNKAKGRISKRVFQENKAR